MASGYSSTAAAGAMTSEEVAALLIEPLLAEAVTLRAGPRIFDTKGVLLMPTIASLDLDDPWRAANVAIGEEDRVVARSSYCPPRSSRSR